MNLTDPDAACEQSFPKLDVGPYAHVEFEFAPDLFNDLAIFWWLRVLKGLQTSHMKKLDLIVYHSGADTSFTQPWMELDLTLSSPTFADLQSAVVHFRSVGRVTPSVFMQRIPLEHIVGMTCQSCLKYQCEYEGLNMWWNEYS